VPVGSTLQVSVTVTNNIGGTLGGSATLTNAFTYVPGGGGIQQPQIFSVNPASGTNDGGTLITILGQGFVAPVQVFFGSGAAGNFNGIEATIQSVTATQIIVISPPARGFGQDNTNQLVSILVKNTGSGFATIDGAAFKYGSKVIVTSVGPNTIVFNQPTKVTIFGQGFADPVAVTLAGIGAQVLSTSGTEIQVLSGIPAVSSCANVTGPVSVTNINNGDNGTGLSFTYLVLKPAALGVNPSSAMVPLAGLPGIVEGSSFIPGEDQVQFGTSSAQVTGGTTTTLNVIIPFFTGTYLTGSCGTGNTGTQQLPTSVPVTVTDFVTTCTSTLTGGFTYVPPGFPNNCVIPPPPPPSASFVSSVPTGSFTVSFTDTSTGNPTHWAWNFGDGATSGLQNPTHTYAVAGTYNVVLVVSNAGGTSAPATNKVTVPGP
jgi:PKD domain/IPT/TIG domain